MPKTLVMKFGGTSVGSAGAIRQLVEIVRTVRQDWPRVAIVVSAMNGATDALLDAAQCAAEGDDERPEKLPPTCVPGTPPLCPISPAQNSIPLLIQPRPAPPSTPA